MWHNCWQMLVETSQARKHTHSEFKAAWWAMQEGREGFGFSLARLMLQKLMLNNIFMHGWSFYPAHHSHTSARKDVLFISEDVSFHDRDTNARRWCFFYGILLCCRGSKCKYFTDPLWSFHTDCQGLQSLNSPEIKKRGAGESNHFSTSSLPDLSSLTHAPRLRRKDENSSSKMTNTYGMWRMHSGHTHSPLLECCTAAFYLKRVDSALLKASNLNCRQHRKIRLSLMCRRLHSSRHRHVTLCLIRLRRQISLELRLNFYCLPRKKKMCL